MVSVASMGGRVEKTKGGLRRPSTMLQSLAPQARTVIFGMVELHTS
jgi:hypothetical protein